MTWREFKHQVDSELDELGLEDNVDIWYVDVSSAHKIVEVGYSGETENKIFIHVPRDMN